MRTLPFRSMPAVVALVTVSMVFGCADPRGSAPAATVDGVEIPMDRVERSVQELIAREVPEFDDFDTETRASLVEWRQQQVLTLLVQAQVIAELVAEHGVDVDLDAVLAEVDAEIDAMGGEEALAEMMQGSELTPELFRDVLYPAQHRVGALRDMLLAELPAVEERSARHILVETEQEADALVAELDDGADFAELAGEHSIDSGSAARGGDLGTAARGAYVPPFDDAVWAAEIGVVVGPVGSDFGFHVIEVTGESVTEPQDLGPQQADALVEGDLTGLLDAAFESADVRIAAGLGEWNPLTASVVGPDRVGVSGRE